MSDIDVYFVRNLGDFAQNNVRRGIYIRAADDNWNDFGYQSLFDYAILDGKDPVWRRFRLGFADIDESPYEVITNLFAANGTYILASGVLPEFFSMQIGKEEYHELLRFYGAATARAYLLRLGDVAALQTFDSSSSLLTKATSSNIFALSLIRTDAAFDAFRNARFVLSGRAAQDIVSAPSTIDIPPFRIGEWRNEIKFTFRFQQRGLFPKRIAVLIGPNGCGKSLTLRKICESYLDRFTRAFLQPVEKLVAFATPGSADTTFPLTVENEVFYVRISDFGAELSQNYSVSLSRAIYTLARTQWSENEQERLRWVIFQRAVTEMLPFASLAFVPGDEIKFQENSVVSRVVTFKQLMSQSELQQKSTWGRAGPELVLAIQHGFSYLPLSSGQASFVRMAAQLALNVTEGSLVLIDEPETHLHPKFVSQFMAMLDSILGATKSVAVIATHSPFVVREVSKDQVHVLHVNSEKTIEVFRPRLKTFGADVGTISASVFGDDLGTDAADKIVESILADPERYTNWEKNLFTELSVETVLYIRRRLREHGGKHE